MHLIAVYFYRCDRNRFVHSLVSLFNSKSSDAFLQIIFSIYCFLITRFIHPSMICLSVAGFRLNVSVDKSQTAKSVPFFPSYNWIHGSLIHLSLRRLWQLSRICEFYPNRYHQDQSNNARNIIRLVYTRPEYTFCFHDIFGR